MPKFVEGYATRLIVPAGKRDVQEFDDALPGFGIRKFDSGHASYFVKFNVGHQQRRLTLGSVVSGNLAAMRKQASSILSKARLGHDTVAEKRAATGKLTVSFGELVPLYLAARESELRIRTYVEIKRHLENHWKQLHGSMLDAITRADIVRVVDEIAAEGGKGAADHARVSLSGFFAWCIDRGHCDSNPTAGVKPRNVTQARSRVLSEGELIDVWQACRDDDYGSIIRLLLLTGQRREEIGSLGWSEIAAEKRQIELPEARTKNHRAHIVPISEEVGAILASITRREDRDFVFGRREGAFSGWSKAKNELDARIAVARKKTGVKKPMPPWVLHDLRRSFVTHLNERKLAPPHVIEAIVNHVSGHLAGVAGIYNKALYFDERRTALELWARHIVSLVAERQP
jgi:integrase